MLYIVCVYGILSGYFGIYEELTLIMKRGKEIVTYD